MNIHEFQAKELFARFGIPIAKGAAVKTKEEFPTALAGLADGPIVVKSQIHAGGRGKGTFKDGYKGGVKVTASKADALEVAGKMLGNTLVTHQTGPEGKVVKTVYFNEPCSIQKEYYLALTLDRGSSRIAVIASTEGGMDIEEVAAKTPEKITTILIDPAGGLQSHHKRTLAFGLGFTSKELMAQFDKLISGVYRLYWELDCAMVEINPLITTPDGRLIALDAKVSFDDNALYRHADVMALRDLDEEDPKEVEASKHGLNYVALDGNIACLVNGAGLAMATMDIIKHCGGNPANFLDVGGGATREAITEAFKIILSDPNVEGILVNIFGGIMSCKRVAEGVLDAARAVQLKVPLVVRLEGNEVAEGKKLMAESGLAVIPADSLLDAAQKIVAAVKAAKQ